ncbi:MAG: 4Fe-4S dicluster domain-containing protein [Deltaproteobacteria bacterium]|nr:4Fe-4S dicluster domain-containing protein [Deltaproteobacteria bacterium]
MSSGDGPRVSRRGVLKVLGAACGTAAATACAPGYSEWLQRFFQEHYQRMTPEEVKDALARMEREYQQQLGVEVRVKDSKPIPGVRFGYALNISKCKGYRECVRACIEENNLSRDPELAYIRVLEMDNGTLDLERSDHYYEHETVPQPGKFYLPVSCMQCDNAPCVKACPVKATWAEPDGVVVVDYDWCIGCRACQAACPYGARHFNWGTPTLPPKGIQTDTHVLGNRPRPRGVVEKCTFCLHRTREGRLPACHEACPTGARVFGNLLDPASEIRWVLEHKTVFRLKEGLKTEPKFWYYSD